MPSSQPNNTIISVIIVNWNSGCYLKNCIDTVIINNKYQKIEIIVVDNNSTDDSLSPIKFLPEVKIIKSSVNLGFGKACNLGASKASGEYLLFLNPDTEVSRETISTVFSYMQSPNNSNIGICGIQLIDENKNIAKSCARFPTPRSLILYTLGIDRAFPNLGYMMNDWDHQNTRLVDHVIGAFFFVRRSLFFQINGFDEDFFVYLEDLDFSYRAYKAGWSSMYLSSTNAFHAGGGCSRNVKSQRLFYSLQSRIIYSFKHFDKISAYTILLTTVIIEPILRSFQNLLLLSPKSFRETIGGYIILYKWLMKNFKTLTF